MAVVMWLFKLHLSGFFNSLGVQFILALFSGIVTYFIVLFLTEGINIQDINRLRLLFKAR